MKILDGTQQKSASQKAGPPAKPLGGLDRLITRDKTSAQDVITNTLSKLLDNRFFLLTNTTMGGVEAPVPLILIGPPGIWLIYPISEKGIYRATDSTWEELNSRTHQYSESKTNPIARAAQTAEAITGHLTELQLSFPKIEPVLFFSDPGVHVDAVRPIVRILLADALERFTAGMFMSPVEMEAEEIQAVVDALVGVEKTTDADLSLQETRDAFSFKSERAPLKLPSIPSPLANVHIGEPAFAKQISKRVPFSRRQWILLALLLIVNLVVLAILVLVILFTI
jgi:hypothetical protein